MIKQRKIYDTFTQRYSSIGKQYNKPLGKFRKKKALDCGRSKCYICGGGKKRKPTRQEKVNQLNESE